VIGVTKTKPAAAEPIKLERIPRPRCRSTSARDVCRGEDYLYKVPGQFYVAECTACGLWFQNPCPHPASLHALYPSDYGPHAPAPTAPATRSRRLARRLLDAARWRAHRIDPLYRRAVTTSLTPTLVPSGAILEIGCANGARLVELRRLGWRRIVGIEFVPAAAERARALGFEIVCDSAENALDVVPNRSLDAVVSSMVLEHMYDPFAVVNKVAGKLKPGAQFLFSTIVRDSLDAAIYGQYWAGFDFPRHMVHFTRNDIRRMLGEHFSAVRFVHQVAPVDFVRSSSWRKSKGEGRWLDGLFLTLGESLPARLFNLVLAYIGRTTRVSVYCRRNGD